MPHIINRRPLLLHSIIVYKNDLLKNHYNTLLLYIDPDGKEWYITCHRNGTSCATDIFLNGLELFCHLLLYNTLHESHLCFIDPIYIGASDLVCCA